MLLLQVKEVSARHQPTGLSAHFNSSVDDAIDCVIPKNCTQTIVEQERCFEIHTIEEGLSWCAYMLKAPSSSQRDKWVSEVEQAIQAERKREESELYRTWPRRLQRHIRRAYESGTFQVCACVRAIWCHTYVCVCEESEESGQLTCACVVWGDGTDGGSVSNNGEFELSDQLR